MQKVVLLLFFIFLISLISGFSCETHQYICKNFYNFSGNCCLADQNKTPAMYYHHCTRDLFPCEALSKSREYESQGQMDIYFHLTADANSPAHWFSLEESDHSKFEDCVNKHIVKEDDIWECNYTFIDKTNISRNLYINQNFWINAPKQEPNIFNSFITLIKEVLKRMIHGI